MCPPPPCMHACMHARMPWAVGGGSRLENPHSTTTTAPLCHGPPAQGAETVASMLRTLHACFEAVDLDDAVLRLTTALKLALLLKDSAQVGGPRGGRGRARALRACAWGAALPPGATAWCACSLPQCGGAPHSTLCALLQHARFGCALCLCARSHSRSARSPCRRTQRSAGHTRAGSAARVHAASVQ